jgi:hypothetical protein
MQGGQGPAMSAWRQLEDGAIVVVTTAAGHAIEIPFRVEG